VELDSAMFMSINPASGLPVGLQCDVLSATRWYCIRSRILNYGLPRSSSTNLDSSAGNRRRVHLHRRCCLGHGLWSSTLESGGRNDRRQSSGRRAASPALYYCNVCNPQTTAVENEDDRGFRRIFTQLDTASYQRADTRGSEFNQK